MTAPTIAACDLLSPDRLRAVRRAIRDRLPPAPPPGPIRRAACLMEVADDYDGFLFDDDGVLTEGDEARPGAVACLAALRATGRPFRVLATDAGCAPQAALARFRRMGLDLRDGEVLSARTAALSMLGGRGWGAITAPGDALTDAGGRVHDLLADGDWSAARGIVFLSAARWDAALQDRLVACLRARPRPVVVAGPDLTAPRAGGPSALPGLWAHDLQQRTGIVPHVVAKPCRTPRAAGLGGRVAMVGDVLHVDVPGGMAAGCDTILVTGRGGPGAIRDGAIAPDVVLPSL